MKCKHLELDLEFHWGGAGIEKNANLVVFGVSKCGSTVVVICVIRNVEGELKLLDPQMRLVVNVKNPAMPNTACTTTLLIEYLFKLMTHPALPDDKEISQKSKSKM